MSHPTQKAQSKAVATLGPRAVALDLRAQHKSYRQIAEALGVSISTARKYVVSELKLVREQLSEIAVEITTLELKRLDKLGEVAFRVAMEDPEPARIAAYLKVADQRCKLLDLYPRPDPDPLRGAPVPQGGPSLHFYIPANGREGDMIDAQIVDAPPSVVAKSNGTNGAAALQLPSDGRSSEALE